MSLRKSWAGAAALAALLVHSHPALAQGAGDSGPAAPSSPDPTPDKKPSKPEKDVGSPPDKAADDANDDGGDEQPVNRPPPAGKGVVYGVVTDGADGETVIEAKVSVIGSSLSTLTNVDGGFRLELPPGTYQLRIFYEAHKPARVDQVRVVAGQLVKVDFVIEPEKNAIDVIEVETQADTSSVEGQILARKRSAATGDSIGRKEMAKAPDKNAAEAAKRVVGATIEGNRFVFVRGLGERYTNALLDGAPLPSPEPDKQAIPLDLFPTSVLDGIVLVKTFTPDVPGDFSGGSVRIATRRYTEQLTLGGGVSLGLNTQSSFARGLTYQGSPTDFLGFDSGKRGRPGDFPTGGIGGGKKKADGSQYSLNELTHFGRELNTPLTGREHVTPPNMGLSFVSSKGWKVGTDGHVGFLATLTYDRRFEVRNDEILRTFKFAGGKGSQPFDDLRVDRGIDRVNWGILAGVTYEPDRNNRFLLTGLYSRASDNSASNYKFASKEEFGSGQAVNTTLDFVQRGLAYGQLRGEHDFKGANNGHLDYFLSLARADRDEPDRRSLVYTYDSSFDAWSFFKDANSGSHFFSSQAETSIAGALDWTQPITRSKEGSRIKFGSFFSARNRDFHARNYDLEPLGNASSLSRCPGKAIPSADCVGRFFSDENLTSTDGSTAALITINDKSRLGDTYGAHLNVFAGYAMFDGQLTRKVRLIVGPRLEASFQAIHASSPVDPTDVSDSEFNQAILLPAAAVVYSPIEKVNLRFSVTRTVARPQLREIAPFRFTDYIGGIETEGNPGLLNTSIINGDLRFEVFPKVDEVIAVSAFYKQFSNPIEAVIEPTSGNGVVSFQNANGARLYGMEFEARKSLDFMAKALRPFSAVANLTLARSRIDLDPTTAALVTNKTRALSLQAPYIVNIALDFDEPKWGTQMRVSYNIVGKRITLVGRNGLPDFYQQPRHQLDFVVSQAVGPHVELRGSAANLVDSPVEVTAGSSQNSSRPSSRSSNVSSFYKTGRTFSLGVGVAY